MVSECREANAPRGGNQGPETDVLGRCSRPRQSPRPSVCTTGIPLRGSSCVLVSAEVIARRAELWYQTGSLGGTAIADEGNLYLEEFGDNSIVRLTPDRKATTIYQDPRLHWADARWIHDGCLYLLSAASPDRSRCSVSCRHISDRMASASL